MAKGIPFKTSIVSDNLSNIYITAREVCKKATSPGKMQVTVLKNINSDLTSILEKLVNHRCVWGVNPKHCFQACEWVLIPVSL